MHSRTQPERQRKRTFRLCACDRDTRSTLFTPVVLWHLTDSYGTPDARDEAQISIARDSTHFLGQ